MPFQDFAPCAVAMGLLTFFSLASTAFLLLEAITIARRLVPKCFTGSNCAMGGEVRVGWMAAAGFLVPLVYTLAAVPGLNRELAPDSPRQ